MFLGVRQAFHMEEGVMLDHLSVLRGIESSISPPVYGERNGRCRVCSTAGWRRPIDGEACSFEGPSAAANSGQKHWDTNR
jgi:hypothetical protein